MNTACVRLNQQQQRSFEANLNPSTVVLVVLLYKLINKLCSNHSCKVHTPDQGKSEKEQISVQNFTSLFYVSYKPVAVGELMSSTYPPQPVQLLGGLLHRRRPSQ